MTINCIHVSPKVVVVVYDETALPQKTKQNTRVYEVVSRFTTSIQDHNNDASELKLYL